MLLANAGLPLLMPGLVLLLIGLIPISLLEAWWYYRHLPKLKWDEAYWGAVKANLWSTLMGIPLTWFALFLVQMGFLYTTNFQEQSTIRAESLAYSYFYFFITSPWLIHVGDGTHMGQVVLGAMMVLMVPCFVISYTGEAWVLAKRWPEQDKALLRRHSWYAHCITYGILFTLAIWRFTAY